MHQNGWPIELTNEFFSDTATRKVALKTVGPHPGGSIIVALLTVLPLLVYASLRLWLPAHEAFAFLAIVALLSMWGIWFRAEKWRKDRARKWIHDLDRCYRAHAPQDF